MPAISSQQAVSSLLKNGCQAIRQKGSHLILQGPNGKRSPIPDGKKALGIGLLLKLLRYFEIERKLFLAKI